MLLENFRKKYGYSYRSLADLLNTIRRDDQEVFSHSKVERLCKNGEEVCVRAEEPVHTVPPIPKPSWYGRKSRRDLKKNFKIGDD